MNTTNNKTSLYDSVKKNDKKNIVGEINKGRLDSVPRGNYITILDKFGEVVAIFIHAGRVNGSGFLNPLIAYYPGTGWLKECPCFKLDEIDTMRFASQTEIEILLKNMAKEGYIWDGWQVIKAESLEEEEDEVADVDETPAEEESIVPSDKKECILDKAIENKIAHNIKVAKDIIGNTLPYYAIDESIEPLARTTNRFLNRDINNFNYFTNKEDVDEAIRRVRETLMNFQEEIQNKNK